MSIGLVLSGGGARAAYQAGVISALAEIAQKNGVQHIFKYFTGVSAGAINATMLAATPGCRITEGSEKLLNLWRHVTADQVYVTDPLQLSFGGVKWMADLSLGGLRPRSHRRALLDTSPLRNLIKEHCDFANIQKNIEAEMFSALAISALDYFSTSTVTFVQGSPKTPSWQRVRRQSESAKITADHLLASSAIPLLFPPVTIERRHYGDGSIRNHSPCGPAIYLGAKKLIAIGVRKKQEVCYTSQHVEDVKPPTVGRVASVLLHAVMMDGLEVDIERLERINSNILKLSESEQATLSVKPIEYLWISPSRDFSEIATNKVERLPRMIRYLLRGLGSLQDASEIASFLLFDPEYCRTLTEIGYEDGWKQKEPIERLLSGD
ncbi:MAG: patatin family protein [Bdellovibrio sp. ArHS]|uniref:patatin-like phospholipase family protein n=1 Tax=Bdellovibrio sp. ArHS TaxID=1569284 RepID=UPI000583FFEE|nr:patatin-like phospholipase family protein [Bdellovibrio sp. ArHS]KHD88778.1 MAG: patatin family protein [Bdellovibrio sp. ArHS]